MGELEEVIKKLEEFVVFNEGTAAVGVQWDTLKAFLRGILIQRVAEIKKRSREWEESIRKEMEKAEKQYIEDPTPEKQNVWLNKQENYRIAVLRKVENKRLFQKQLAFGEGESVGRMLAYLVRTNSSPSTIPAIRTVKGEISSHTSEIRDTFRNYYETLYKSQVRVGEEDMDMFFKNLVIPTFTEEVREGLEVQITLAELQQATTGMENQKSPGPDGLPIEIYKRYGKILLPELLK